jgi:hypothetical protein
MDTIRKNIALRHSVNQEIIEILSDMVERYPDLRFGQILAITEAIQYKPGHGINDDVKVVDPFNEESVDMWIRMRDKMMQFNRNVNNIKKAEE